MATITQLPEEVINIILENETISMEDIVNFKCTCKRFWQITLLCKFWEKKYYQSCPTAKKRYNKKKQNELFYYIDFKKRIEAGLYYMHELQYYAYVMSENKLSNTNVEHLIRLLRLIAEDSMVYYFVWDEMNRNFAQKSSKLFFNLTHDYIFKQIFHCLKHYRFIYKQIKFMNIDIMSNTNLILEKQLTIVAQYFAPHVSYSAVKMWLNSIAQTVLSRLKNKYPNHSICSTTLEYFFFWRDNNIDDNFWNETESKQIMCVLEEYIFSELEIHKLHQLLKTTDLEVKYIKYFAECFRRHLLTITYHIIARKLGVRCYLIRYKNDIGIIWKPKYIWYTAHIWHNAEFFYISPDSNLSYPSNIIRGIYQNAFFSSTVHLFSDISVTCFIMKHYYIKLKHHNKHGRDFDIIFTLYQCLARYKHRNIYTKCIYEMIINTIKINSDENKKSLKKRTKEVKFAIGMIVRHTWEDHFSNDHDGVIIGWHNECDTMFQNKVNRTLWLSYLNQCMKYNHVCKCLKFLSSAYQPHYILLADNNEICYVRQDQLSICPPKKISSMEVGRYFCSFEGTHYIPNESLREDYPEDTAVITKILCKQ